MSFTRDSAVKGLVFVPVDLPPFKNHWRIGFAIGIMENKMATIIVHWGFYRVYGLGFRVLKPVNSSLLATKRQVSTACVVDLLVDGSSFKRLPKQRLSWL